MSSAVCGKPLFDMLMATSTSSAWVNPYPVVWWTANVRHCKSSSPILSAFHEIYETHERTKTELNTAYDKANKVIDQTAPQLRVDKVAQIGTSRLGRSLDVFQKYRVSTEQHPGWREKAIIRSGLTLV